jgi:medium-chain acyl-[acyl-carrier-protein] hydrolase
MGHSFLVGKMNSLSRLRLFCLPYAGAGSSRYFRWAADFPEEIEVCPILLPGREGRIDEPPYRDIDDLTEELSRALAPSLDRPFAIFGHSMGALIGFELARKLRRDFNTIPAHLFVSGYRGPQLPHTEPKLHNLAHGDFIARIRSMQDAQDEATQNVELMELMLPTLRADLQLCETYQCRAESPLECPIGAFGGMSDRRVKEQHLAAWSEQTSVHFNLRMMRGGHLYLNEQEAELIRSLCEDLAREVASR